MSAEVHLSLGNMIGTDVLEIGLFFSWETRGGRVEGGRGGHHCSGFTWIVKFAVMNAVGC